MGAGLVEWRQTRSGVVCGLFSCVLGRRYRKGAFLCAFVLALGYRFRYLSGTGCPALIRHERVNLIRRDHQSPGSASPVCSGWCSGVGASL